MNFVSRARFLVAAPTLTVGTVRQLEDAAAGCALGVGLTQTTAPALKREKSGATNKTEDDEEMYSDPDEGVEIVDMEKIREMDWMAPESLAREREAKKRSKSAKVKNEQPEKADRKGKGAHVGRVLLGTRRIETTR